MLSEGYTWAVKVEPARIWPLFILTSHPIGSLELEPFFRPWQYTDIDCSFPFREVLFWYRWKWRNLDPRPVPEPSGGGGGETLDFNASVSHSLILLWRRNRWRKLIYIDFNWILCFVILKGHNYFHCEVFMIQWNCFLAKHNCFEACLIVVSGFHFCSFSA